MPDGKALAQKAIAARDASIPKEYKLPESLYPLPKNRTGLPEKSGILDKKELEIINLTVIPLAKAIADKKYSAVEVATAYCKAAAIAQQATNCVLEEFQDEALSVAKQLDEYQAKNGKTIGPLHGVPISIKDHVRQKGHAAPCGFLYAVDQIAEADSHLWAILKAAGAVPYVRTINCQAVMHLECRSAWGATLNPWNVDLVPGGSSGGEGALLAMRGSPLGIGSDIGGSVRSPAAACGIFSFKPSIGRVPNTGAETLSAAAGYEGIISTLGPMRRSTEDLELIMKIVAAAQPWKVDPSLHVKPWRQVQSKSKLKVGVLRDDGVVRPVESIARALDFAVDKLKKAGFEVVEYKPYKSETSWELITKLYFPDGGKLVYDSLAKAGEPADPMTDWIVGQGRALDRDEIIDLVASRDQYRMEVAQHWQQSGVDIVLSPVGPTPAPQPLTAKYWNYTSYWNLANYPAGVFPTGLFVDESDCKAQQTQPRNDKEREIYKTYDPKVAQGAPLCLQVIGYIGHEEETLDAMKKIVHAVTK